MIRTYTAISAMTLSIGFTIGVLVGLSQSPVVAVVLPILFSVIGGTGGFYFSKIDITSTGGRKTLSVMSIAITLFCVGTLGGIWFGIDYRTSSRSWSLLSQSEDFLFPPKNASEIETVEWLLFDAKLHLMGLSAADRRIVVNRVQTSSSGTPGASWDSVRVHDELGRLVDTLEPIIPSVEPDENRTKWTNTLTVLQGMHQATESAEARIVSGALSATADRLRKYLDNDDDDQAYIQEYPAIGLSLIEFRIRLRNLLLVIIEGGSLLDQVNTKLDTFLSANPDAVKVIPEGTALGFIFDLELPSQDGHL